MDKTTPGEVAAVALSQSGREAVEPLTAALRNNTWQARANAAFALGLIHDSEQARWALDLRDVKRGKRSGMIH